MPKTKRKTMARVTSRIVLRALKNWEKASSAYLVDCNKRLIKKPDAKRRRLRLRNRLTFNRLISVIKMESAELSSEVANDKTTKLRTHSSVGPSGGMRIPRMLRLPSHKPRSLRARK